MPATPLTHPALPDHRPHDPLSRSKTGKITTGLTLLTVCAGAGSVIAGHDNILVEMLRTLVVLVVATSLAGVYLPALILRWVHLSGLDRARQPLHRKLIMVLIVSLLTATVASTAMAGTGPWWVCGDVPGRRGARFRPRAGVGVVGVQYRMNYFRLR